MSERDGSKKTSFTTDQIAFMKKNGINPENLYEVYEKTDMLMRTLGWEKNYVFNEIGLMCEEILDVLDEMDD